MTAPDLSTPEAVTQARAEAVALLVGITPGKWELVPVAYDLHELALIAPRTADAREHLGPDETACTHIAGIPNTTTGDAALITASPTTTLSLIAALDALAATRQALAEAEAERDQAAQALIYAVQAHPQGDICQDWSSWRVGFGRGVSRGYGRTDAQQLISAVCQATKHDDPYQIPTITEFRALAALNPQESTNDEPHTLP